MFEVVAGPAATSNDLRVSDTMPTMHFPLAIVGLSVLVVAAAYAVLALIAVLAWRNSRVSPKTNDLPPVTVLKPLCGAEPRLYENLRSFCQQHYPQFQLVFGVRDAADPA